MTPEKNQNAESLPWTTPEYKKRKEEQLLLLEQIKQLKTLRNSLPEKKVDQKQITSLLDELEKRAVALDLKNQELFNLGVEQIQHKMDQIHDSHTELSNLKDVVLSLNAQKYARIAAQLPDHSPVANLERMRAGQNICAIHPEEGEHPWANRAARKIQELLA